MSSSLYTSKADNGDLIDAYLKGLKGQNYDFPDELKDIKAQLGQLESKVNCLSSVIPSTATRQSLPEPKQVILTGRVSCGHCEGVQPVHKGYTPFSWALYSVSQGDDVVLVASDRTYTLQGDRDRLLKLISGKARVTGRLESNALQVETITRAPKQN